MKEVRVFYGNAATEAPAHMHWLVGSFIGAGSPLNSEVVEIKYGKHEAGECRTKEAASQSPTHTTIGILISGKVRYSFPNETVTLEREGDYVLWHPNVLHWWKILEPSLVLTIRWRER